MTTIQIPDTVEAATTALNGVDKLLTAKAWERAAIVWAFTYEPGQGARTDLLQKQQVALTAEEFAALGINGLTNKVTVYRIRGHWQEAIDDGYAKPVNPGETVALPDPKVHRYPPTHPDVDEQPVETGRLVDRLRQDAAPETKAAAILEVMARDPEAKKRVQDAFVQETGTDHTLAGRVFRTYAEHNVRPAPRKSEPMLLTSMGFGSVVYSRVKDLVPRLGEYVDALSATTIDDEVSACVQEDIDDLDKTKGLIEEFSDKLRQAIGTDADTVAQRLLR